MHEGDILFEHPQGQPHGIFELHAFVIDWRRVAQRRTCLFEAKCAVIALVANSRHQQQQVCPAYKGSVEEFYSLYSDLSDKIEDDEFAIQPAFFHPDWMFAGLSETDPVNFEKRAPYPTINLLRRASIEVVVHAAFTERGVTLDEEFQEHNTLALELEGQESLVMLFKSFHL